MQYYLYISSDLLFLDNKPEKSNSCVGTTLQKPFSPCCILFHRGYQILLKKKAHIKLSIFCFPLFFVLRCDNENYAHCE